jgi:hypothetical protein
LKPFSAQPDPAGELVQFIERVGLQVPTAGPSSPVADCEEVINVGAQSRQPATGGEALSTVAVRIHASAIVSQLAERGSRE